MENLDMWVVWLVVAVLFIVIEIFTVGFAVICFAIGALFATMAAFLELSVFWQLLFFAFGSLLSLLFIRPVLLKILHQSKEGEYKTNADALIGRKAKVLEVLGDAQDGYRVKIDGDVWQAIEAHGMLLEVGNTVTVIARENIILTVQK